MMILTYSEMPYRHIKMYILDVYFMMNNRHLTKI